MDAAIPLVIFENTREVYAEVASYPVVPPEKIKQYWNAYTTTFRRLFDPSAFRLENFWWHVWGSERLRNLSGPRLAKLYEEFSNGPTFVPIPPPPNPFIRRSQVCVTALEATPMLTTSQPPVPRQQQNDENRAQPTQNEESPRQESAPTEGKKEPTPSSSRPPPPHPILKKSRGPSASGPRPTARFASPPTTEDEATEDGNDASSKAAATEAAAAMPPPPLPSQIKKKQILPPVADSPVARTSGPAEEPTPTEPPAVTSSQRPPHLPVKAEKSTSTRKVVASTAASRRRPVMVRRPSSQSGSDTGTRGAGLTTASKRGAPKRSTATAAPLLGGHGSSSSQTSDAGLTMKAVMRSAKASGPRPPPQAMSTQPRGEVGTASARSPSKEAQQSASEAVHPQVDNGLDKVSTKPTTEQALLPPRIDNDSANASARPSVITKQATPPPSQSTPPRIGSERQAASTSTRTVPNKVTPPPSQPTHSRISSSLGRTSTRPVSKPVAPQPSLPVGDSKPGVGTDPIAAAPLLLRPASPQRRSTWDVRDSIATAVQNPPPVAGFVADQPNIGRRVPSILRTRPKRPDAPQGEKDRGVALLPARPTSSVAMATTTALARFDSETLKVVPAVSEATKVPEQAALNPQVTSSVFQQFKPTPRHPAPPIPFGRSKSELTLLLERGGKAQKKEAP
ncbi:hypothetical protein VTJ49DRAFT_1667 [Mycothermus thermophilus]|uniref:Nitrogen regulatory protein areA GATA-like domain-containing protein n=1 Tax=Humicola insolens TaxID=85995 RepID=A0ABR3VBT0_HUMIN